MPTPAEKLSFKEKLAYGLGDTASNFYFQFFNLFLVFYYTDIFGLAPALVGTMVLAVRVFDAVLDPAVGIIADRTHSKYGKFRPYILWGAVPYGVLGYAMFLNPALGAHGKLCYAYVTYGLMWAAYTAVNIPYSALMGVMSPSSTDRTSLSSFRFVCAYGAALLIGSLTVPLKNLLGHGNDAEGIRYTMLIFSVISVGLFFYTFSMTRERVQPPPGQRNDTRRDLMNLLRSVPWLILFFANLILQTSNGVRNGAIIYFFKYTVGGHADARLLSFYNGLGTVAVMLGIASTALFLRLGDKKKVLVSLYVAYALLWAGFYFVRPGSFTVLLAMHLLASFLYGPTPAIMWSMYADAADYGEWKFGRRSTGLVFSASIFAQKIGFAVGSALVAWSLGYVGYVANAAQSSHANTGISLLFSVVPAAFAIAGALAMLLYPLGSARVRQMEGELAARKAAAQA